MGWRGGGGGGRGEEERRRQRRRRGRKRELDVPLYIVLAEVTISAVPSARSFLHAGCNLLEGGQLLSYLDLPDHSEGHIFPLAEELDIRRAVVLSSAVAPGNTLHHEKSPGLPRIAGSPCFECFVTLLRKKQGRRLGT